MSRVFLKMPFARKLFLLHISFIAIAASVLLDSDDSHYFIAAPKAAKFGKIAQNQLS